jgi:GTPase SAR1 family protein
VGDGTHLQCVMIQTETRAGRVRVLFGSSAKMEAIRVSFVGDCATGKTSTIVAISSGGSFPHDGIEQAQVDQANSAILKRKGKSVTVNLVDTSGSGEDDGDRNRVSKYQDSDILCVLFSIISPFSYDNVTAKVR